ncbi:thiamine-phosphate kinase [Stieleria varia]|uniref:Thiamine-monophosphate kinase n=1 Tax=Stieleria varia TaxID=2528005 RepID=A0A5C6AYD8_9BACT|nr:thiamine-phosphate kinase [Stieleria varia]TWU04431.1 Thiamine-monophosphate kinase [Stieleria varia]
MEQSFLAYLRGRCRSLPQVELGIGDDAAVLAASPHPRIVCTDQVIDGVDFLSAQHDLVDVGYKAMAINLSDIAAMGGQAESALVTLALPKKNATKIAGEVYEGILQAASEFQIAIAGGDLSTYRGRDVANTGDSDESRHNTESPLAISITLIGSLPDGPAWKRSGAQVGDAVLVSGHVGGSILGRHLRPTPRLELSRRLRELADVHAAIDISDGLSLDLDRLCAASGVGIELDIDAIPIHQDALRLAQQSGRTPFEHAWSDGEDFELIVSVSEADASKIAAIDLGVPLTRIGTMVGRTGLWKRVDSKFERLAPQGHSHL